MDIERRGTVTDLTHHLQRIDQAHQRLDQHDNRLTKLETVTAVAAERSEHIQKSLDKIENGQSWIIRLVLGAMILAALTFALKGGLNVGQ